MCWQGVPPSRLSRGIYTSLRSPRMHVACLTALLWLSNVLP